MLVGTYMQLAAAAARRGHVSSTVLANILGNISIETEFSSIYLV